MNPSKDQLKHLIDITKNSKSLGRTLTIYQDFLNGHHRGKNHYSSKDFSDSMEQLTVNPFVSKH